MRLKRADQLLTFASTFTPPCSLHALARTVALSVVPSAQAYVRWTAFLVARAAFLVPFTVALPICFAASAVSLPASFVASPAFFVSSLAPELWAKTALPEAHIPAIINAEMSRCIWVPRQCKIQTTFHTGTCGDRGSGIGDQGSRNA